MSTVTTPKTKAKKAAAPKATEAPALSPAKAAPPRKAAAEAKQYQRAAIRLKQASDPTRLRIMMTLLDGERFVGELCQEMGQSQPAVSHHLSLLRHGQLIIPFRRGKQNFYSLSDDGRALADALRVVIG